VSAALSREIWAQAQREGINIFGAGAFGRSIAQAARSRGVTVHAFLSSAEPAAVQWQGIPVMRADTALLARAPTWVGVFNREPHSDYSLLQRQLAAISPDARLVWPQLHYECLAGPLGWRFWLHPLDEYRRAEPQQQRARSLLEDAQSRAAFDAVLDFRRALPNPWQSPAPDGSRQYLPDWLRERIDGPLRAVDAGAYHGETLRELSTVIPVAEAWTFEPDLDNYAVLARSLAGAGIAAVHVPAGLSDRSHRTAFSAGLGEASHVSPGGELQASMVALDECLPGARVNFLKLDVEGNELAALRGARATLLRERPVLAVAAYHRWDDLWRIPLFVDELNLGYRIRLRLHAHNSFDSVYYAY
jgi:FkbM family methyltransferase